MTRQLITFLAIIHESFYSVISKEITTESITVTDLTAVTGMELIRSESKGSGFYANKSP